MNILIACDSFKDALDAPSACRAIERGLQLADPFPKESGFPSETVKTRIFPLADGGEGFSDILNFHLGLKTVDIEVHDPLFRKIKATYNISVDGTTAFIEMAQAAGLQLLTHEERNPLKTTTFGVGEMINDALKNGVKRIVLGIGGSATNDAGVGMAAAMGWQFFDEKGEKLSGVGGDLNKIQKITPPSRKNRDFVPQQYNTIQDVVFEVMCDVKNPLLGKTGAAHVYSRQKGASDADIDTLEAGATNFWKVTNFPKVETEGAGAAGGLGFGALFFLNATIKSGIHAMMDLTDFDKEIDWADVIFTGEGRLDSQTAHGKLIAGIVSRSQQNVILTPKNETLRVYARPFLTFSRLSIHCQ